MMARKDKVVGDLTRGVEFLFRKNKVDRLKGRGRIAAPGHVALDDGTRSRPARSSSPPARESIPLPGLAIDEQRIVSSTGALALTRCRERLVVIGGGYIGLELGSVWRALGAEVTVVEYLDRILPNMDRELGPALQRLLARTGIASSSATKVAGGGIGNDGVTLELEPAAGGEREPRGRRRAGGDRAAAVHRRARPRRAGRGAATQPAASRSTTISRPMSPASTRSAT